MILFLSNKSDAFQCQPLFDEPRVTAMNMNIEYNLKSDSRSCQHEFLRFLDSGEYGIPNTLHRRVFDTQLVST